MLQTTSDYSQWRFKIRVCALGEEGRDGLFSPRVVLTNVAPFNAPFPLSVQVPSSLCVFTLFTATSRMFYLLSWES